MKKLLICVLIFSAGLGAVFYFYLLAVNSLTSSSRLRFENETIRIHDIISQKIDRDAKLLYTVKGLFASSQSVEKEEFIAFAESLQLKNEYPGIFALEYVEASTSGYLVKYGYPEKETSADLALNLAEDPARKELLDKTARTEEIMLSEKLNRLADGKPAVFLILPVTETGTKINGWVRVILTTELFFPSITADGSPKLSNLGLSIYDVTDGEKTGLYEYETDFKRDRSTGILKKESTINLGGRTWMLDFSAERNFGASGTEQVLPAVILSVGTVIAFLIAVSLYLFITLKSRQAKEGEDKFKAVVNVAKDGIIMMDAEGKTVLWNHAAEEIFGYTAEEVLGKKFHEFITTIPEHRNEANIRHFGQSGESAVLGKTLELPAKKKDGTLITFELTVAPVKIRDKWFAVGIARDITLKNAEKQELLKFKMAVAGASDHVVITDNNGIILYANDSASRITGYSSGEIIGKKAGGKDLWGGLMPGDFYTNLWTTIKQKKESFTGVLNNRKKSGEKYEAQTSISPILDKNGEVAFFVGIERDISVERAVDRAKTEFVSLASHQLRTPLSAINWYTELLRTENPGTLSPEQKQYLEEIDKGGRRMVDLVNALLNVSRLELGTFMIEPEPVKLPDVITPIINEQQPAVQMKKHHLTVDLPDNLPVVNLDRKLFGIVIQNLLSNAVKYTPAGGEIHLSASANENSLAVAVSDNGIGIPDNQKDKIFNKLFRADNAQTTDTEGTGLGLYIVKRIIEESGGAINLKSEVNKGTTFTLTLPLTGMKERKGEKKLEKMV